MIRPDDAGRIKRFSIAERVSHWVHTFAFFTLFLTGLVAMTPYFAFLAPLFGGLHNAQIVHRWLAPVFSVCSLAILIIGDWNGFKRWMKSITDLGKDDFIFLRDFPQEFMGGHPKLPEQGMFNAGEKMNSIFITLGGGTILTVTGIIMWFPEYFPLAVVRWSYPLHSIMAMVSVAAISMHMFMALIHPGSKESIKGMIYGTVDRKFAAGHHPKWYREVTGQNDNRQRETE
ncbi:MAG: formate dehydrogenase, gamma subunit [Sporomusa sp.]|nr:formate dehydrogenase, gamma subunit [Sporomusa sp.]